jgi:hypothetical protein
LQHNSLWIRPRTCTHTILQTIRVLASTLKLTTSNLQEARSDGVTLVSERLLAISTFHSYRIAVRTLQRIGALGSRCPLGCPDTDANMCSLTSTSAKLFEHFIEHCRASRRFLWLFRRSLGKTAVAEL